MLHSAALVYLEPERRAQFVELMRSMSEVTWVSNEGERILPAVAEQPTVRAEGRTVVAVNGLPCALVGPHGQSYEPL